MQHKGRVASPCLCVYGSFVDFLLELFAPASERDTGDEDSQQKRNSARLRNRLDASKQSISLAVDSRREIHFVAGSAVASVAWNQSPQTFDRERLVALIHQQTEECARGRV